MTDGFTETSRPFGFVEWFRIGERERAEAAVAAMQAAGASRLRTHLSWADYHTAEGQAWYDWLIPMLGTQMDLLPCLHYTPPSLSRTGRTSGPPRRLADYADFVDHVLTRYGRHFPAVELWNEPNNLLDWDWRIDSDFMLFSEMVGGAAFWARKRGWKTVLGGLSPFDPYWLNLIGTRGVLAHIDAMGFHGFPGTWDSEQGTWDGWDLHLGEMRAILDRHNPDTEIWITETGYSTWRNDEVEQVSRFVQAMQVPAQRFYWYGWRDIAPDTAVQEGLRFDPRHYHLGVKDAEGRPKLLARLLAQGGPAKAVETAGLSRPYLAARVKPTLIIGGSGFIGANLAESLLADGEEVLVLDNLYRSGVEGNLAWLRDRYGERVHPVLGDIRDGHALRPVVADAKAVFHFAAQTAVTSSLTAPEHDFEVNARGTLNVLESARATGRALPVIFASTNKVYGGLEDLGLIQMDDRYVPQDADIRAHGIDEGRPLDFHTPYGCSKGVADQYVLDYGRSFGLPTAVLRMSCIYGPRQFGTEDQGWVAHFLIRALAGQGISLYGDGKQVRDILHVADTVAAYRAVLANIGHLQGRAFNLGGGPRNAVSLRLILQEIEKLTGRRLERSLHDWRQGDQLYFVADTRRLEQAVGWRARIGWRDGLRDLAGWLRRHRLEEQAVSEATDRQAWKVTA
ncbi:MULTISPECIES: NAD-dependent epimerase/dehydratase family protein [unclassified Azospirillum]|uniref:NAD-dependent epimerase/dehydratase family protein n=1 Tax=unclassified Azospirillum TaxID=2630922 RepID=UPI000B65DBD3|nr:MULTISPECIES: NAD-dependent epimerase/dehydratase family protein [unclassified Azospirillum]SNS10876.1 CDP-paratose 2-epimerase [Azospirillum sp. RU38E]SNS27555.1 CDP-paratose 2-epimerase [Azospirillum sp. RU37A]